MIQFFFILIRFIRTLWHSWKDPEFQALFFLVVVILASGAMFYPRTEGWSFLDSLYFSVITPTTVGYGDFSPSTVAEDLYHLLYIRRDRSHIGLVNAVAERSMERRGRIRKNIAPMEQTEREEKTEELYLWGPWRRPDLRAENVEFFRPAFYSEPPSAVPTRSLSRLLARSWPRLGCGGEFMQAPFSTSHLV